MMLESWWFLIVLIIFWMSQLFSIIWETIFPLINSTTVDLRTKFGEWAVVTGATDGIGKAYAKELAKKQMNLILISRSLDKLEKTKSEILNDSPNITIEIIEADFSKGKSVFENIRTRLNVPIGILINNVGKMYDYPMYLDEVPEDDLWEMMTINVGATTIMTRLIIKEMKKRRKGVVVNISSGSEHQPLPLMAVYAATKTYLKSFSNAIKNEYSQYGITVQHLSPMYINTKMNSFSPRLQVSSLFVPDPTTYAKNAVATLGKVDSSSGYWAHNIQTFFILTIPIWMRTKIGRLINERLRKDYFQCIKNK